MGILKIIQITTHLGFQRANKLENDINIKERIRTARRTKYSLMGSDLHGTNGVDPITGLNFVFQNQMQHHVRYPSLY